MTKSRTAKIYRGIPRNISFLAKRLQAGDLVAVPTETVYGLAGNALDAKACARIFKAKRRPRHDPLIVHLHSARQLNEVAESNSAVVRLAKRFWPGPLTVVLRKRACIPSIVCAGSASVAVRVPAHPLFRRLLKAAKLPLAAPSANPFGYVSPTTAGHVWAGLGKNIRYILDGGPCEIGLESTIVDLRDPTRPRLLRPGSISRETIEEALGRPVKRSSTTRQTEHRPQIAPGLLARHYSPRTPVTLHRRISRRIIEREDSHVFILRQKPKGPVASNVFWLDLKGDLPGSARRLFSILRTADAGQFAAIHVELVAEKGLGVAINDRLRRAATR